MKKLTTHEKDLEILNRERAELLEALQDELARIRLEKLQQGYPVERLFHNRICL